MDWSDRLGLFAPLDFAALAALLGLWLLIGWLIEHSGRRPSVSRLVTQYRRDWMVQMVTRQPRIFDAQTLATLRQGTTFFASATMIAIGGALAMIGNADRLTGLANALTLESDPPFVWEVKVLTITGFLTNAFLKFVWSHRLFGYCAVLMAATPNDPEDPDAQSRAGQAADLNIFAARSFNQGLRSIYFALGTTAWMLGSEALIAAAALTFAVLWRREFASQSRKVLMESHAHRSDTSS
ncbi:DUF599 domain-containing protein [Pseudooceanicola sp.]|uniref:DUF599 domain-containing protein n=1 Tax=Pseudooceanicola sp. TaxID=1914328 RepID=UPI00262928B6|nr:DUF599 domain-containing protein [Pseudooceanicola sp.]MDF1855072.1 DUF599 domain-containing protein [Pseudooceanicola sp.]